MTQKLGHARTVPSACPARRGRNWSPEDGAGLGAWRVGGDDPVPVPRTPQAVQCDVSVEEDSHQEWTFTLYGFDNSGKATREVADKEVGPAGGRGREFSGLRLRGGSHHKAGPRSPGRAGWSLVCPPCAQPLSVPSLVEPGTPVSALASSPSSGHCGSQGCPSMLLCCLL